MKPSMRTDTTDRSAAFMGHEYALEAEECAQQGNLSRAEQFERLASDSYLRAMDMIRQEDTKTRNALKLIADSHEQRAIRWHMLLNFNTDTIPTQIPSFPFEPSTVSQQQDNPPLNDIQMQTKDINQALQTAATEMEELFERLNELGFLGKHNTSNGSIQGQTKQYLSSALGDSFCLLPKNHGKSSVPLTAYRVDGEATLKAAVANRMKNQRERLMEKQTPRISMKDDTKSTIPEKQIQMEPTGRRPSGSMDDMEVEQLKSALAHQKYEANRLMHTVKSLSSENTKLIQEMEQMTRLREENKRLFAVLKRALEEWRRQKVQEKKPAIQEVEKQFLILQNELTAERETNRQKDIQLKRYETWFKSLKESARAKQQSRESPSETFDIQSTQREL